MTGSTIWRGSTTIFRRRHRATGAFNRLYKEAPSCAIFIETRVSHSLDCALLVLSTQVSNSIFVKPRDVPYVICTEEFPRIGYRSAILLSIRLMKAVEMARSKSPFDGWLAISAVTAVEDCQLRKWDDDRRVIPCKDEDLLIFGKLACYCYAAFSRPPPQLDVLLLAPVGLSIEYFKFPGPESTLKWVSTRRFGYGHMKQISLCADPQ